MGIEENEALLRKVYDEYNKGNYDVYDEFFADDFISIRHDGTKMDKTSYKQFLTGRILRNYPDIQRTIDDLIVTDDRAALYYSWTGTDNAQIQGRPAPTGNKLRVKELYFIRFKDGKISEYRQYGDAYSMMLQMGALADRRPLEENREIVRGFIESANQVKGDVSKIQPIVDKFISPNHIHHRTDKNAELEETLQFYEMYFTAFPDLYYVIEDLIAEGDKVVARVTNTATHKGTLMGIPPTGNKLSFTGTDIFRVVDGKITDEWSFVDQFGMMQQLGVIPTN
jgi:steroid delta-isomerase-like uncharacterized protein